jgi:exonuclease III
MTAVILYLLIITLNVNELNSVIKRHTMTEWINNNNKKDPTICCLLETYFTSKDPREKVKILNKALHESRIPKKRRISHIYVR